MLCTVVATPVAVIYRLSQERRVSREIIINEQAGPLYTGRIAYIAADKQLYTMAPDGSDRNKLTGNGGSYQFPAWSPDGSQIAVVSGGTLYSFQDRDGAEDSGAFRILYQDDADRPFYLYWAPDGSAVSFLTNHADGLALHLATIESPPQSRALAFGQPFYWDWDPGGEEILIHSGLSGEEARLAFLNREAGDVGRNIADPGMFQAPGISYDGHFWAYAQSGPAGRSHLTIQGVDGESFLQEQERGVIAMSWSPAEQLLAYIGSSDRQPAFYGPLQIVSAESGDRRILVSETVIAFFWSPDGRAIAYLKLVDLIEDSVQVDSKTNSKESLSKPANQEHRLRLELWVIDISEGEPRWLTSFEPSRVFMSQFLPYFDQYALSHRIWSPSSDALIVPMQEDDRSRLYVVPVDGGNALPVASGDIGFWSNN
jgi:TolB protein